MASLHGAGVARRRCGADRAASREWARLSADCSPVDSRRKCATGDYGVTTSPSIDWWFVKDPVGGLRQAGLDSWPAEAKGIPEEERAEKSRKPLPLSHFEQAAHKVNQDLEEMDGPQVIVQEEGGVRLYTGPMFEKDIDTIGAESLGKHTLCQ